MCVGPRARRNDDNEAVRGGGGEERREGGSTAPRRSPRRRKRRRTLGHARPWGPPPSSPFRISPPGTVWPWRGGGGAAVAAERGLGGVAPAKWILSWKSPGGGVPGAHQGKASGPHGPPPPHSTCVTTGPRFVMRGVGSPGQVHRGPVMVPGGMGKSKPQRNRRHVGEKFNQA